ADGMGGLAMERPDRVSQGGREAQRVGSLGLDDDPLCDLRTIPEVSPPGRANSGSSLLLALQAQQASDDSRNPFPILRLARELFSAAPGDRVVLRLAVVFRCPPL